MAEPLRLSGPLKKNDELFVAAAMQDLPYVHAYCQKDIEVVYGPSCINTQQQINVGACESDGVAVLPRRGGGGTVVLMPGMVITVVVGARRSGDEIHAIFSRIHRPMIELLKRHGGITLAEKGLSDLACGDRKVLGSSLYLSNRPPLFCYQSSLMVDADISLMERYLKYPPREPEYRGGRSHTAFCSTLKRQGCSLTAEQIVHLFNSTLRTEIEAWQSGEAPLV